MHVLYSLAKGLFYLDLNILLDIEHINQVIESIEVLSSCHVWWRVLLFSVLFAFLVILLGPDEQQEEEVKF